MSLDNMDFWADATGDEKDAFAGGFTLIPENTTAIAEIQTATLVDDKDKYYEFTWQIIDGEHAGRKLWQKVQVFNKNADKAKRAKNMLMLLFRLCSITPPKGAPGDLDLMPFQGKLCSLLIRQWHIEGKEGNYVAEVHAADYKPAVSVIDSAFSRNPANAKPAEDEIPF